MKIRTLTWFIFAIALQGQIAQAAWTCHMTRLYSICTDGQGHYCNSGLDANCPPSQSQEKAPESVGVSAEGHLNCKLDNGQAIQFTLDKSGAASMTTENRQFSGSYQEYIIGGETRLTGAKALDIYGYPNLASPQSGLPYESVFAALTLGYPQFGTGWGEVYFKNANGRPFAQYSAECSTKSSSAASSTLTSNFHEVGCCIPGRCRYMPPDCDSSMGSGTGKAL